MTLQERLHDMAVLLAEVRTHQQRDREAFEAYRTEAKQARDLVTSEVRQLREGDIRRAARNAAYGALGGAAFTLLSALLGWLLK